MDSQISLKEFQRLSKETPKANKAFFDLKRKQRINQRFNKYLDMLAKLNKDIHNDK